MSRVRRLLVLYARAFLVLWACGVLQHNEARSTGGALLLVIAFFLTDALGDDR
jgi:hypothetical protein